MDMDSDISDEEVTMIGDTPVHPYVSELFSKVITGLQAANGLPQGDDYEFYKSFRAFPKIMNTYAESLLELVEDVAGVHTAEVKSARDNEKGEAVMELLDLLFESIDTDLDLVKAEASTKRLSAEDKIRKRQLLKAVQTVRPQETFKVKPNNSEAPFTPYLYIDGKFVYGEAGVHPFKNEIDSCSADCWLQNPPKPEFKNPSETPLTYVDKSSQLDTLIANLVNEKELAIDLENHSMHSFQGFLCLMQISTRKADYIIDCLELRSHMYKFLPIFTNPAIEKVLHGASSDIEWLQRDFGLYIINMFDTGIAAQQLSIPHGLGKLLAHYGISTNKQYQTADWRQRPLPAEMLKYARLDTHYLLAVADDLRSKLTVQGSRGGIGHPLLHVVEESRKLCLRQYKKPTLDDEMNRLMGRMDQGVWKRNGAALKSILKWRDTIARLEDESYASVLSNTAAISLAQELPSMDLCKSSIFKLFVPTPRLLQKHVSSLIEALPSSGTSNEGQDIAPPATASAPTTAAELLHEVGWGQTTADEADTLWDLDEDVVKVLEEPPSKLHQAIQRYFGSQKSAIRSLLGQTRQDIQSKRAAAQQQNQQAASSYQQTRPGIVPAGVKQGTAKRIQGPQGTLGSGSYFSLSGPGSGQVVKPPKQQQSQPEQVPTSLNERNPRKKEKKKRAHDDSKMKKCKPLPHTADTSLVCPYPVEGVNDFLKRIGWETVPETTPPRIDDVVSHRRPRKQGGGRKGQQVYNYRGHQRQDPSRHVTVHSQHTQVGMQQPRELSDLGFSNMTISSSPVGQPPVSYTHHHGAGHSKGSRPARTHPQQRFSQPSQPHQRSQMQQPPQWQITTTPPSHFSEHSPSGFHSYGGVPALLSTTDSRRDRGVGGNIP